MYEKRTNTQLKVGLAQVDCKLGNIEENIKKVKQKIDDSRGVVDLLVFPELSLTGYGVGKSFHQYALRADDDLFLDLVNYTRKMTIMVGFIEETDSFHFYNSVAVISERKIKSIHRKIFLPNYGIFEERKYFTPGTSFAAFDLCGIRFSPLICGDAWNPALVHLVAADRVHVLVFSVCSPEGGLGSRLNTRESWKRLNRFYASMYGIYVIFVNRVGSEQSLSFWGESEIIDPFGQVVCSSSGSDEETIIGELNLSEIREARTTLHTVRDDDLGLFRRNLDRIIKNHYP